MDFVTKLRDAMNSDPDYTCYEDFSELSALAKKHLKVGVHGVLEFDGVFMEVCVFMGVRVKKFISDNILHATILSIDFADHLISDDPYSGVMDYIELERNDTFHFWTKTK